ncbi:eukaryotic translation initiation factor 2-alpha kinase 1-like isoform X3 [Haliotis rubra]|uniref:eukaryotic translation initiation factor 2-alpha kinase 1-like isoform X3 n=1 Tax=Haliotis rubra TaxID=36100 RepID=UPI001EE5624C|nr:eukaryotic translation initiation factor 2-alpha kinase 1-like isoform X3 [Haliotis rubra]
MNLLKSVVLGKEDSVQYSRPKNHLDGREYAVKKVKFSHRNAGRHSKLLREVKALAGLTHSNIVGYNAAWLEHGISGPQTSSDTSHTSDDSSSSTDSASFGHQGNSASVSIVFGSTNTGDDLDDRQGPKILELDPNSGNRAQHRINIQISLYTSSITFQVVECVPTTEKCEQFLHCHQSIDTWSCRAKPQHRHW